MPEKIIVIDLETQKGFQDVGRDKYHRLKISVAGVYSYQKDQYLAIEEKDMMTLEPIIKDADLIVGFNIIGFDLPVLAPYLFSSIDNLPTLDLLAEIEKVLGHRVTLDSVAEATLKRSKTGSGKDAIELFKQGRMEELKRYCLNDVELTKEIYEYGLKHGKVFFRSNRDFRVHEIPVTWKGVKQTKPAEQNFPTSLF
ncbi:MAG: ribonuclease H-like domain-containing protein [Candidatus Omnitrophica bacterium]|nr:ribonuclease H-like domain-containing protein [Candidatus Omnitrophota bacterium]